MNANVKVSNKRRLANKSATDTKPLDQNSRSTEIKVVNARTNRKKKTAKNLDALYQDTLSLDDVVVHDDEWMLKYDINEMGIGKILLPPSLSILLQSDRVSISPSAGGLFIRSI